MKLEKNHILIIKIIYLFFCLLVYFRYFFVNFDFLSRSILPLEPVLPYFGLLVLYLDRDELLNYKLVLFMSFFYLTANTNFNFINDIVPTLLLCVIFSNEDPIDVAKPMFNFLLFWLLISIVGSLTGLLPFVDGYMGGRHHYILNFTHHNKMALYLFGIMALAIYLYKNKILKNKCIIIFFGIIANLYTFIFCDSRTGGIAQLLLIFSFIFDEYIYSKTLVFVRIFSFLKKWIWITPVFILLFSMLLSITYQYGNKVWFFFDLLLTGRLGLQHEYYLANGFPLLGVGMKFCGYGCEVYDYVDNAFLRYVYENGLIFTLLFLTVISLTIKKHMNSSKDIFCVYFLFIYALIGLSEWISFVFCPFVFMLFCNTNRQKEVKYD